MRKSRGFALTDLALALGILGIVSAVLAINLFKDQKQERAKEIASVLIAIDQGFNTLALSQQLIPPYRGETSPMPYPTLTTSANDETMYVRIIRETYGKGISNSSGQTLSLADYRANLKDLARRGQTLTFNITGGYTLSTISVSGIDDELNNYLSGILGNRWDRQNKAFRLNNGSGYTFRPFYINKVVGYTSGSNGPIAQWDSVFVGYRLDNGREPVQTHANNSVIPAIYEEGGGGGSGGSSSSGSSGGGHYQFFDYMFIDLSDVWRRYYYTGFPNLAELSNGIYQLSLFSTINKIGVFYVNYPYYYTYDYCSTYCYDLDGVAYPITYWPQHWYGYYSNPANWLSRW